LQVPVEECPIRLVLLIAVVLLVVSFFEVALVALSGQGMASRYHWVQRPDLSPATSRMLSRQGSNANRIRTVPGRGVVRPDRVG
jgi:hypothetical protein